MHEVIVDMVGPQAPQLLIEEPVEILRALARSMRQLGRQQHPVTQPQALKRGAHARLVTGIEIRGVQIINPLLHRTGNDGIGCLRIRTSRAPGNLMQPRPNAEIRLPLLGSTRYCTAPPFAISAPARRNTMVTQPKHRGIAIENVS